MAGGAGHDQLELITPGGQVRFFDLDPARGIANIGRHPDNDIVLDSPAIQAFHAILDYHEKPYQLIWLDAAAGPPRPLGAYDPVQLDGYSLLIVSSGVPVPEIAAAVPLAEPLLAAEWVTPAMAESFAPPEAPLPPFAAPAPEISESEAPVPPAALPELDLEALDAVLAATEPQKDEIILVEVHILGADAEQKGAADLDLTLAAGETATLEATIANGGEVVASFDVTVPGLPLEWVSIAPGRVNLAEGGRVSVLISITPPRKASVHARGYFYSVAVTSPEYPGRLSNTPGMLAVKPFYQFAVGSLDPRQQTISYSRPAGEAILPLINQGNSEASFRVEGEDERRLCRFEFQVPGEKVALADHAEVRVPPDQTLPVRLRIIPTKRPLVALGRANHPYTLTVTSLDTRQTPRSVLGQAQAAPLVGPLPIILAALLLVLLFVLIYRPVIHSFEASSNAISAGETVSLTWKARQFSGLRLEPDGLSLPGIQGTVVLAPTQDVLYTLTANNLLSRLAPQWFKATRQARVSVSAVLPAFRQFSVDRSAVTEGESVNLAWDVTRADKLTLIVNGAAETLLPKEHIGNRTLRISRKTTVVLTAVNAYTPPEGVSRSLVVEVVPVPPVIPPPPVIKRFDVSPQEITAGQLVLLSWEVTGVPKISITGIGELPAMGSVSAGPTNDTIYTLSASNGLPGGATSQEQRVLVRPAPTPTPIPGTPRIEFFKANPSDAILGSAAAQAVQLTWQVSGDVTNIEIASSGSAKSSGLPKTGTLSVAIDKQTLFIMTAYNGNLSTSQTVQVTVSNPLPSVSSLQPASTVATAGATGLTLVVNGTNFTPNSKVRIAKPPSSAVDRTTTYINSTSLTVDLLANDIATAGPLNVSVFNPTPGGGSSTVLVFNVINPTPVIAGISPPSLYWGGAETVIFINGTGFVADSKIFFGGVQHSTTFMNGTRLSTAISAQELLNPGVFPITVRNPAPSGTSFVSNAVDFTIWSEYPVPQLVSISPTSTLLGSQGFTLTVTGAGDTFVKGKSAIGWWYLYPTVTFSDTNSLSTYITADMLPTTVGLVNVKVYNPTPGGGYSNILTFSVDPPSLTLNPTAITTTLFTAPTQTVTASIGAAQKVTRTLSLVSSAPTIVSVPSTVDLPAGSLSVNFVVNGLVASSQGVTVTAQLPPELGSAPSVAPLIVKVANPTPTLTSISPNAALVGGAGFYLYAYGSNFVGSSTIQWNGTAQPTTFLSRTSLRAYISASRLASPGSATVTVVTAAPGGGASNGLVFDLQYRLVSYFDANGTVASTNRSGINCGNLGTSCEARVASTGTITFALQATPRLGYAIDQWVSNWAGGCSGSGPTCTVTMDASHIVGVHFAPAYNLTVNLVGQGNVTSDVPGINCTAPAYCPPAAYVKGRTVILAATATSPNYGFLNWQSADPSPCGAGANLNSPSCVVFMDRDRTITAVFELQYAVTVAKTGDGGGTISSTVGINCGSQCVAYYFGGTSVTFTATPDSSSIFTGWGGACASAGTGSCTLIINGTVPNITANFLALYPLTVTKTNASGGSVTGAGAPVGYANINLPVGSTSGVQVYPSGSVIDLSETTASGYYFVGWSGACTGLGSCSVTMGTTRTVTADFRPIYSVAVGTNTSGSGNITSVNTSPLPSTQDFNCGTLGAGCGPYNFPGGIVITLTATPATDYVLTSWSGGPCNGAATNPCVFTLNQSWSMITANFQRALTLTFTGAGTGTVTSSPAGIACSSNCTGYFNNGTIVTLSATASTGATFSGWSGACTGTGTCTVTMDAARAVSANFVRNAERLTLLKAGTGDGTVLSNPSTVTVTEAINCGLGCTTGTAWYFHNDYAVLTATAAISSTFTGWSGDCSGTTATCSVHMTSNKSVTATFAIRTFALTVARAGNAASLASAVTSADGNINCGTACSYTYNYGTSVTLSASGGTGYNFTGWSGACSGTGTCTVDMTAAATVTATYTLIQYQLSVTMAGAGSGTVTSSPAGINCTTGTCTYNYDYPTSVTLTATPGNGSDFTGWSGGCSGTGTCTVTMDAARDVTATFARHAYQLTLYKIGTGDGTVVSTASSVPSAPAINCALGCTFASTSFYNNDRPTLTASAPVSSTFAGWSGACTGTNTTCDLGNFNSNQVVTATFTLQTFRLQVTVTNPASGTVTSTTDSFINCGRGSGLCSHFYDYNSGVTLRGTPSTVTWGGACSSSVSDTCNLTITGATDVTATFP